jgi:S1-C subfamily serine protease
MNTTRILTLALAALLTAAPLAAQDAGRPAQARGWLGIAYQQDERAPRVVVIRDVLPGSPAARAGVVRGDTVLRLNRRPVTQPAMQQLRLAPGDTVRLGVRRAGREREFTLVAATRPREVAGSDVSVTRARGARGEPLIIVNGDTIRVPVDSLRMMADSLQRQLRVVFADSIAPQLRAMARELEGTRIRIERDSTLHGTEGRVYALDVGQRAVAGAEFTPMNPGLADYFRVKEGLLVLRVAPGTPAARAKLEEGDVVTRAGGKPVPSVRDLRRAITAARGRELPLEIVRKGKRQTLTLRWER